MIERAELATVEKIGLNVVKRPLDFAFGLRPPDLACPGAIAIVRGEGQEACVVDWLVVFPTRNNHFHVVVKTRRCNSAKVFEGLDVLSNGGFKVLT